MRGTAIIHLIGYPGVGKLTIARALSTLAATRGHRVVVMDNHLTGNPILSVLDDGPPPAAAWELVYEIREVVNRAIGSLSPADWSFVFTNVLWDGDDTDRHCVERLTDLARQRDSRYVPVLLACEPDELVRRATSPGRREQMKLADPAVVLEMVRTRRLLCPDADTRIDLDVTDLMAESAAARILAGAGLAG